MVLLAKCLLLLFMIIVVHGNIVVDVEQKVQLDGCCNGCCPCNSCEPVKYKCRHHIDGICRKECLIWEIDMGDCEATNGEDCDYQCCFEDPCWNNGIPLPETNLATCTIKRCVNRTIIEEKPCADDTECCLNPKNENMICPGTEVDLGGCTSMNCTNSTMVPNQEVILGRCVKCRAFNDPHFEAFSSTLGSLSEFDWQLACNHALTQVGVLDYPNIGLFMKFMNMGHYSAVGPTIYKEFGTEVRVDPATSTVTMPPSTTPITIGLIRNLGGIWVWQSAGCTMMYGTQLILIELCKDLITIWAPEMGTILPGWPGGYPELGGLCSRNNLVKKLFARNGVPYPVPGQYIPCNGLFGKSWQTKTWGQTPGSGCPVKRKKRSAVDPQTICSNVTNSDYHEECHEIIKESELTGPDADMFYGSCMFDLCMVVNFVEPHILTKAQMVQQIRGITKQAKIQEDNTIDCIQDETCKAVGGTCILINDKTDSCYPTLCSGYDCTCCILGK